MAALPKFEIRRTHMSDDWFQEEVLCNGAVVPHELWNASFEITNRRRRRAWIAYWMEKVDGETRLDAYMDAQVDHGEIEKQLIADDHRKKTDPARLHPEARRELELACFRAFSVYKNLDEGSDAILEGREPEYVEFDEPDIRPQQMRFEL
jgi:hypothetical protein